jgi:hypothetical protein
MTVQNWTRLVAGLLASVGLLLATGCDSTGPSTGSAQGAFTLRLTDDPADLDSAVVTVDRVELVGEDADDDSDDEDDGNDDDDGSGDDDADGDDDGEEGIITLTDSTRQIDLLRYQDGNTALLADDVTVPGGEYSQLRFVLGDENYVVRTDGSRPPLKVGSQEIKIILPEVEIENDGDRLDVTLDFDVEESFIEQGNGDYRLKPTIKVKNVFVNGNAIETVSVEGPVTAVDAGAGIIAVDSINFATTSNTEFEDDGTSLSTLSVGQYVGIEGTLPSDGSVLEAREIEGEDDEERSITARIEALGDQSLTVLGTTIEVTDNTEFDDDGGFGALQTGTRVEVDYIYQEGIRVATEIETEDDD